jgi:hypothetical protein
MESVELLQSKIQVLKKKVQEKRKAIVSDKPDLEYRQLRKQLKRLQRKRRRILLPSQHLQGAKEKHDKKVAGTSEKKETAPEPQA